MSTLTFWIVTAHRELADRWKGLFRSQGWAAEDCLTSEEFLERARSTRMGIALVDWSSLGADPKATLESLKSQQPQVSFILVGEEKVLNAPNIVRGLEAGADDFFSKFLEDRVLMAKMRAHLRRILPSFALALEVLQAPRGDLKVDKAKQTAWIKNSHGKWSALEHLTPKEFNLLCYFLERPGMALERRLILEGVWQGKSGAVNVETVDKHVESLRKKLGPLGKKIRTIYGLGYSFKEG